jgi:phosphoribosyl-ATP pyrophosphohydrolase
MKMEKIPFKEIRKIVKKFLKDKKTEETKKKRGRPKKYKDDIIFTALLFMQSRGLSFRDLRSELKERIKKAPHISNLHYRFKKIDEKIMEELLEYVRKEVEKRYKIKGYKYIVIDGTGFGYNTKYNQRIKRGKEIRQIKSHIRVGVIIGVRKDIKKNIVMGVKAGKAYESEVKIAKEILEGGIELNGEYFIGDKAYDSTELIKDIENRGIKPAIKVKETFRIDVKDERRKRAKRYSEDEKVYKERNRIESVFGNVKRGGRDYFNTKKENLARIYAISLFILFNIRILLIWLFKTPFLKVFTLLI